MSQFKENYTFLTYAFVRQKKRNKENDKEKRKSLKLTGDWRLTKINKNEFQTAVNGLFQIIYVGKYAILIMINIC